MANIRHKSLRPVLAKSAGNGEPDEEALKQVNQFTLADLSGEQIYVRTMYLAHNAIDRDGDVFESQLLGDFARTLPGKGLFYKHPNSYDGDSGPGEGRFFAAKTVEMSLDEARAALREPDLTWPPGVTKAVLLEASFYLLRIPDEPFNKQLLAKIDGGIVSDVSIGFSATSNGPINDQESKQIAYSLTSPGEALEGSLVWLGAQPGARITKSLEHREENTVDELEQLQKQVKNLKTDIDDFKPKAAQFDAIKTAIGDLASNPDGIKAAVTDGQAYRKELIDQAIAAKRLMGMVGDTEEEVNAAKGFYATMPITVLKSELKGLQSRAPAGGSLEGSDPNHSGAEGEGGKGLRNAGVTQKQLGIPSATK